MPLSAEIVFGATSRGAMIREGAYGVVSVWGIFENNLAVAVVASVLVAGSVARHGIAYTREESQRVRTRLEPSKKPV